MSFVRSQANLPSKVLHRDSEHGKTEKESDRLRVDVVKNKPGMASLQTQLFTSVFSCVIHSIFVPVVNKARLQRQILSGVRAETKLKDSKALKPEITQFLYQSPEELAQKILSLIGRIFNKHLSAEQQTGRKPVYETDYMMSVSAIAGTQTNELQKGELKCSLSATHPT